MGDTLAFLFNPLLEPLAFPFMQRGLLAVAMVSALPYVDLPKAWMRRALPWWPLVAPVAAGLVFGFAVGLLVLFVPYLASGPLVALRQRRAPGHGS